MRSFVVAGIGSLFAVGVACTTEPGNTTIIIQQGPDADASPIGDSARDAAGQSAGDGSVDDAADAGADAAVACTGPAPSGMPLMNCEAIGACTLDSCTTGEAYSCQEPESQVTSGYPKALEGLCVYSAVDSATYGGHVNCCPRACVRRDALDVDCQPGSKIGYQCPTGMAPPLSACLLYPGGVVGAYCCP
jgi:hypothetical protein